MTKRITDVPHIEGLPHVRPFVELGVGASYDSDSSSQWDVDTWEPHTGTSHWVGETPYWLDITAHVQDIATFSGRERVIDQFEVGTATITVDNTTGLFDFGSSAIDLAERPLLEVQPGRSVRVGVNIPVEQPPGAPALSRSVLLWAGYVDGANPTYDAVDGARMILECIDAKGDAGRATVPEVATATGAGQTVNQRINTVLDRAGWPSYRRDIDGSGVTLIATTYGSQCVDLLNLAADSSGGSVFGDLGEDNSDPRVAYRHRDFPNYSNAEPTVGKVGDFGEAAVPAHWEFTLDLSGDGLYDPPAGIDITEDPPGSGLYTISSSTETLHWVEAPDGQVAIYYGDPIPRVPGEVCPSSWELTFNRADISTQAILARSTDTAPRIYPTPAQIADLTKGHQYGLSNFGIEPFERTDLDTSLTADLDWLGERILTNRSWMYMPRVNAVTVTAKGAAPDTIDLLANASPFAPARFICRHKDPGDSRVVFNRVMMVVGVEHTITPLGWDARIALDEATPFLVEGVQPARWDQAGVALWDVATWADPI
jgi:hypothetical protein